MNPVLRSFRSDLTAMAAATPNAVAVTSARDDRDYSYAHLTALLERFGPFVRRYGITPERPLFAAMPNAVEPFVAFLAMLWHGAGYAPLTADASPRELRHWIQTVTPAAALVSETTPVAVREELDANGIPCISVTLGDDFAWLPPADSVRANDGGARLYLQTSGTTGDPRALVFDADRLWSAGCAFLDEHPAVTAGARFLDNLPLSYLGGLFNLGLIPLAAHGSTVIADAFSGKSFLDFWQTLERYAVTNLWLVPTIVRGLLTLARHTRRAAMTPAGAGPTFAFIGTAPIDLATKRAFEQTFGMPLLENFALSETTFFTSERLETHDERVERSVGRALPYADIGFIGGTDADPAEIAVKSPYLALGYRTDAGFVPLPLDPDGFFATGDMGHIDRATGLLVIDGRRRDIIKRGGLFVALREVETVVEQHPAVREAAAVAVPHDFYGESSHLFVRLHDEGRLDDVTAWLRANLVRYKWPDATFAVDDFPRTPTGKIRKHELTAPHGLHAS